MTEKEYIDLETVYDIDTLEDWYINSVSDNDTPVWTEEHLEISGCYGECGKGYLGIVRPDCYCCYGERRIDNG